MAEEEVQLEEGAAEGAAAAKPKSGAMKFVAIGAAVAVLGGGFVAYRAMSAKPEVQAAEAATEEAGGEEEGEGEDGSKPLVAEGSVVPLDPLLVNLADDDKSRFVRATVALVFATQAEMESVKESEFALAKARHVALSLLGTKTSDEIAGLEGQAKFREELRKELQKNLTGVKIVELLLTDFIIQY